MRKLATIQQITKIEPHPNADKLEIAHVLGWKCIVGKGEFHEGQVIIYFEIDSLLPVRPEFEFLRKNCFKRYEERGQVREGFRIRTIRLRGEISQGLIMPIGIFNEFDSPESLKMELGENVTDKLNVMLWQTPIPACLMGKIKGKFPSFLHKTDETRVQVLQDVLTRHKGTICYVTEKIDGTSVTYYMKDGEFGVCSRNLDLLPDETAYWEIAKKYEIEDKLRKYGKNIAIQGEIYGQGLQKNPLQVDGREVRFFNVFDIDKYEYLDYDKLLGVTRELNVPIVPFLDFMVLDDNIDELVELSKGKSLLNDKAEREGIVIRPIEEKNDLQMSQGMGSSRVSFKVINPEYLLVEA